MKKTIAILLAMGCTVSAYTELTPNITPIDVTSFELGNSDIAGVSTHSNITLVFNLATENFDNYVGDPTQIAMLHNNDGKTSVGVAFGEYGGNMELYRQINSQAATSKYITLPSASYYSVVLSSYQITGQITDQITGKTFWSATLYSWKPGDNDELIGDPKTNGLWQISWNEDQTSEDMDISLITLDPGIIQTAHMYNTVLTGDAAEEAAKLVITTSTPGGSDSPTVPEPTTATLSLLALAGLAARRRRK